MKILPSSAGTAMTAVTGHSLPGKACTLASLLLTLSLSLMGPLLHAEDSPEEIFKQGGTAFQAGDFAGAAKKFEAVLGMGPQGENLELILFTLAATYYNQKDLPKAEEYFKRVVTEFPNGKQKSKALISLSQIQSQSGRKEEAAKTLAQAAECGGDLGDRARFAQVSLLMEAGKTDEAVKVLQKFIAAGIKDDQSVQAAMALTEIEAKRGNLDEALKLLDRLQAASNIIDNPLQLDMLAVRIGDGLLAKGERQKALRMYAIVRPTDVVTGLQKDRIAAMEKTISDNKASLQTNPKAFMEVNAANARIAKDIEDLKKSLDQYAKLPDTTSAIRLRQAKAYDELDLKWETILIWENLLGAKDPKIREDALFSIASAYCALVRPNEAVPALDRYMGEYPSGKYAAQAGFLKGAVALEAGDFAKAETVFSTALDKAPDSPLAGDMQFLMGNTQFAQAADPEKKDKYKQAIESYKKYLAKYPSGRFAEEAQYRLPLCYFMIGGQEGYTKALEGFQAFVKKNPQAQYVGDSEYRIALCYNAAEKYDEVIKRCDEWRSKHGGEPMQAEVMALQGDAYAAKEMPAESAAAYRKSVDLSDSEEVLKYSLFEANKQYQKINRWDEIADMFSGFAALHPDHPAATAAVYWVSKAKIKDGKAEEAKQYLAETILKTINDRKKDAVEQLLAQLAQTCSKRIRPPLVAKEGAPAATPAPSAPASTNAVAGQEAPPRPTPAPTPPYDSDADFAKYLNETNVAAVGTNSLAKARLRYAQSELAGFTKRQERQKELMASIYREFPADQLSAMLLAQCGEIALEKGELDKSEAFYKELMTSFPKSDLLEYAYCGMGEVSMARDQPAEALRWFDDAVEKANADAKLAQVTYGKGKAQLGMGKLDAAKKTFEEVAGNKEWRGEVTARALLSLGELEEKRGNTAAAIQYYQRVFVAYQRYPDVVVTAYLKAADGFIKLGEPAKAAAHLREMLSKPRLAQIPRAAEASKKLEGLPAAPAPAESPATGAAPAASTAPATP
jgi:TolA-binding protein